MRLRIGGTIVKSTKKLIALAMASMMLLSFTGCNMVEKTPEAVSKTVVAKVGKYKITRADIDAELAAMEEGFKAQFGDDYAKDAQVKSILEQQRVRVVNSMVYEKIILIKAEELKVVPAEKEMNEAIEAKLKEVKDSYDSEDAYKEALEKQKVTEEELKEKIKSTVLEEKIKENIFKDIAVSDTDIKNQYEMYKYKYAEGESGVELAHILVATQDEAKEIKKQLDDGADFAQLAKDKSKDEATKENGGSIGFKAYDAISESSFVYPAIALQPGQYTDPAEAKDGWHIVKVLDKKDFPPKPFDDVKDQIKDELTKAKETELWTKTVQDWDAQLKPEVYEDKINQQ